MPEDLDFLRRGSVFRPPVRRMAPGQAPLPGRELEGAEVLMRFKSVIARRWLTVLAVLLIVLTGVGLGTMLQRPMYRATGLLEIRAEATDTPSIETLFANKRVTDDVIETEVGLLQSAALAERVIDRLDLANDRGFNPPPSQKWWNRIFGSAPSRDAKEQRQSMINRFRRRLTIDPQKGRLVAVTFEARNPNLAAKVVNGVLEGYIHWRLDDAKKSAKWLSGQIQDAQRELEASERKLQAHVRKNGLQIIETGKGESTNLVNDRLRLLQGQLAEVQADRFTQQSVFEMKGAAGGRTVDDPVIQNLTVRLADLQREYASLSSVYYDDYPKVQQVKEQIAQTRASLDEEVRVSRERLKTNYQAALRREALLQGALAAQQKTAEALTGDMANYEALKREVVTNQQLYTALDQKLKDVTISAALKATNLGIVDRAAPPLDSTGLPLSANLALAACVGLFLGLGMAFFREHLDRSVRTATEVDAHLGLPALAVIPAVGPAAAREPKLIGPKHLQLRAAGDALLEPPKWHRIDVASNVQGLLTEAFAALRTSVMLANDEPPARSLLITSSEAREGKTTVAVNLALSLARLCDRVLLIDADLRHPRVNEALGLDKGPGLATFLAGEADWRACVQCGPVPSLDVITGGDATPYGPAELTSSPRLRTLLAEAESQYDFIVLDSPSALAHPAEVRTLAALVDGTLLTVRSGTTPREAVWQALSQLRRTLGIVLNGLPWRDAPPYPRDPGPATAN